MTNKTHTIPSFENAIDCNFPYENPRIAEYLIIHACEDLPDDMVFKLIYELINPGRSAKIDMSTQLKYIDILNTHWEYPYKDFFISIAIRKVQKNEFSEQDVLDLLDQKIFPHTWSSINLIESLNSEYSEKIDIRVEEFYSTLEN